MSIFRVKKNSNYVVMNRTALNDERLSWKAKGIIAYMLSMPDDWKFYVTELATHSTDGENSLRSGFKELKECGYVKRYPVKDEKTNKILSWETHVFESPYNEKPLDEKPHVENHQEDFHQQENVTLLSTEELSIEEPSTDSKYVKGFEEFWSVYPRKVQKGKAHTAFKKLKGKYKLEDIVTGAQRYADEVKRKRTEKDFIKHGATFLNNLSFLDEYEEEVEEKDSTVYQSDSVEAGELMEFDL